MLKMLIALIFLTSLVHADEIRLMTWNVYMLPKPIKNSHQKTRSHEIAKLLENSDYDLVFLQEAFSSYFRMTLKSQLREKYPYFIKMNRKFGFIPTFAPGLVALSRFPMKTVGKLYFKNCDGPDCHATKGVQLVEVTLPSGNILHVANTHMQAGSSDAKAEIRKLQLTQIRAFLAEKKKPGVPQLLVGDFNINSMAGGEFPVTLATLAMKPVSHKDSPTQEPEEDDASFADRIRNFFSAGFLTDCLKEDENNNPKLLDHVLTFDPEGIIRLKDDSIGDPEFMLKGKSCPLSDHKPLS